MKTNVILKFVRVSERWESIPHLRVKLDSNKFPYIVIDNDKHIIASTNFPIAVSDWNGVLGELDCIEGLEELKTILANPELTVDKLPVRALARVAH